MSNVESFKNSDRIYTIKGIRVMLDTDVAEALGIQTRKLNQNADRSPKWNHVRALGIESKYRFVLDENDMASLRSQFVTANLSEKSRVYPYAYTQVGCAFFGTSMNGPTACVMAVELANAFVAVQALKDVLIAPNLTPGEQLSQIANAIMGQEKIQRDMLRQAAAMTNKLVETNSRVDVVEESVKVVEDNLLQLTAKVTTRDDSYFTVAGWATKNHLPMPRENAAALGKLATKLSKQAGMKIGQVPDAKFGSVGTYHESILSQLFKNETNAALV